MLQQLDTAIAFVVVMLLLSLLVTAIVQAISALLDLRGLNLTRALSDLFRQIEPELRAEYLESKNLEDFFAHPFSKVTFATKLADAVSRHRVLAHTFTRAKAIRKDELIKVLMDLGSQETGERIKNDVKAKLTAMLDNRVPNDTSVASALSDVVGKITANHPELKSEVDKIISGTVGSLSKLEAGVEKWFDTVMDRASDVFTRWVRTITVVISVLLAVILHIDSGLIFHQISTSSDVRAGLTKLADSALTQADEVLKNGNRASAAIKEVAASQGTSPVAAKLNAVPALASCADGEAWLNSEKIGDDKVQADFKDACQRQTMAALGKSENQIEKIRRDLASTNLTIVPDRIDNVAIFGEKTDTLCERIGAWAKAYRSRNHLLGTLAMTILLSLGAPFWYNALKQLANLKPSITQKVEGESGAK